MKLIQYILLACTALFSCTPEPLPRPNPCLNPPCDSIPKTKTKLELVWQTALRTDSFYSTTNAYALWKQQVVYGIDQTTKGKIVFFDAASGQRNILWAGQNRANNFKDAKLYRDKFYLTNSPTIYVFDEPDRVRELFSFDTRNECGTLGEGFSLFGNYLYIPSTECLSESISDYARISRIDLHSNQRQVVFQLNTVDSFGENRLCYFDRPAFWINHDGDSCLLNTYGSIPNDQSLTEGGVLLYNITQDRTEWHIRNFTPRGDMALHGPLVSGDRAYLVSLDSIHCLDIPTGKRIWAIDDHYAVDGFKGFDPNNSDLHIVEDKLYVNNRGVFMCLDAKTGAQIYGRADQNSSKNNSKKTYFDGVFYYTSLSEGRLYGVRASDGKLIMNDRSPNKGGVPFYDSPNFGDSGVVIDEANRLLYTSDGHFALCFKIPENFGK